MSIHFVIINLVLLPALYNIDNTKIQRKNSEEQYFLVVPFIMLYMVILTFESMDEILKCDYSNDSYRAVLSCGAVYYAVQVGSNF